MAVKNYCTMNGQLIGEYEGTRSTDYILDGLGSVIATFRSTGTIQNQYRYSGYGQLVHKSGTAADPYFLWVGGWGYRTRSMVYVRRRTYYEKAAVWTSVDPLWPSESAYGYTEANPTVHVDPLGLKKQFPPNCKCKPKPFARNVPCPDCLLFQPPDAGWPINRQPNSRQGCYNAGCEWYCALIGDLPDIDDCRGVYNIDVALLVSSLPECTKGNPHWKECHDLYLTDLDPILSVLGVVVIGPTDANKSAYPAEKSQTCWPFCLWSSMDQVLGEYCPLECKMRVCCATEARSRKWKNDLNDWFKKCDREYRYQRSR